MKKALVITTINPPRKEIKEFSKLKDWQVICVGDKKTPNNWGLDNVIYLSPTDQKKLFPVFSSSIPWNIYGRKNLGYIFAIKEGFDLIAETDDDVFPYQTYPPNLNKKREVKVLSGSKFINFYKEFNNGNVWPRGLPLDFIRQKKQKTKKKKISCLVQNSLIDRDSDFDAIYRLTNNSLVKFRKSGEYAIEKNNYAPLNSQNTFFHKEAFPLLYMPSFINPHVEDIFRGYIIQRLLWEMNSNLLFSFPTTYTSDRNEHNYMKDFENELPLFLQARKLIEVIDNLSLSKDLGMSLIKIYRALHKVGIMDNGEVNSIVIWTKIIEKYL